MKGVILRFDHTYNYEDKRPIRTFARRLAAHTHAQRVYHVDDIRKSVQKIKNRFIRSFSATTLSRHLTQKAVPPFRNPSSLQKPTV